MLRIGFLSILLGINCLSRAQFAPAAGMPGSTAIKADSSCFVAWGTSADVQIGLKQINLPDSGKANVGKEESVIGPALRNGVLSLGDGGSVIVYFSSGIRNGNGFDFAVFENAFNDSFLELAHVEISADGANFYRFPSISNSPNNQQTSSFGATYPQNIHNLAGKYRMPYGTPFDISELDSQGKKLPETFYYVKIIDVVGSIISGIGTEDSRGTMINDPWPTPFISSGFDLDAIGVINPGPMNRIDGLKREELYILNEGSQIRIKAKSVLPDFRIYDWLGRLYYAHRRNYTLSEVTLHNLAQGNYILKSENKTQIFCVY